MAHDPARMKEEPSLGELFSTLTREVTELSREVTTLVKQEVNLAKEELSDKAAKAGKNIGFLAAGGMVAYAGFIILLISFALMLVETGLEGWAAYLIVGLVITGVGAFLVMKGINALKNMDMVPHQTLETLKEDKRWAKRELT